MEQISNERYLSNVKPILMKVFNDSIFYFSENVIYPFCDSIEVSMFLYSHGDKSYDTQAFWNILRDVILELGDTFVYTVCTLDENSDITIIKPNDDCQIGHSSYHAIFSPSGTWGLLSYFLGGSQSFINSIRQRFPIIDEQFSDFLINWKDKDYGTDDSWLPELLLRIYGKEKAKELLEEAREMCVYFNLSDE